MKIALTLATLLLLPLSGFSSSKGFEKAAIKKLADRVRNYQNEQSQEHSNDNWVKGTYYAGLMAVYESTGDRAYLEQCLQWGNSTSWQIPNREKGRYGSGFYSLVCGQIWYGCYVATKEESMIEPTLTYLANPEYPNPLGNPLEWYYENSGVRFIDGLFTSPPTFAMLHQINGEEKYLDWMDACFWDVYGALYDRDTGLFYRDERYIPGYQGEIEERYIRPNAIPHDQARTTYMTQTSSNGEKILWSRGNGWVFGGLTRILKFLPKGHGSYARYEALFVRMAEALKGCQQRDGFWRTNLADPMDYEMKESSGTSFFTYGITWGINNGILSKEAFLPVIQKSWDALVSVVSDEGKVQWGQLPAGAPYKVMKEDATEFGSGIFLLAVSEVYQLEPE